MTFRKAKTIELHDAHTVITLSEESYTQSAPTARPAQPSRPAFLLRLADLSAVANRLGLAAPVRGLASGKPEDLSLPVLRAYREVPAEDPLVSIMNLECDVQGANLVEIRLETRSLNLNGASGTGESPERATPEKATPEKAAQNRIETLTYSGSFTIWWVDERPTDAGVLMAQAEAHPPIPVETELAEPLPEDIADDLADLLPGV